MPRVRAAAASVWEAIRSRHTWGRSEKILRRNRALWSRLTGKRRRAVDKDEIKKGENE